jgi:hypothetical protein
MEFEYTNKTGPVDQSSPFMKFASQQSAKKREHSPFPQQDQEWKLIAGPSFGQPGPLSALDSPSRNGFATPNRLRDPDSRPFHFSQDSIKPLPSLPPHVWEPRTPTSTYDFSSGGETPNTPAVDSDAATPDTQLAHEMGQLGNGEANSPKKEGRRQSFFRGFFKSSPSPTKERDKENARPYYSGKADHHIQKRRSERSERSRSKKKTALRTIDGDHSDTEPMPSDKGAPHEQGKVQQTYAMSIAGFLHWVEAHPHLPSVLSFYMQLLVNIMLGFGFLYIVYACWRGVMADVDIEASKHMSEVMVEIAHCAKQYTVNRCRPDEVVPAMENACGMWETCMNRDPKKVASASVTAKTFAIIFNSFVEEFSYKSMVCLALFVFLLFVCSVIYANVVCTRAMSWSDDWKNKPPEERAMVRQQWQARAYGYHHHVYEQPASLRGFVEGIDLQISEQDQTPANHLMLE